MRTLWSRSRGRELSHLGTEDLKAAFRFALQASEAEDLTAFRCELLPGLRRLVVCDSLGYNEIDLEQRTAVAFSDAPVFDGVEQRFVELAHEHPLVPYHRRGDLCARLISDFLSVRTFHRLELYHDIYRPLGIEDQLAFGLPGEGIVAINLGRQARTFSERDRELVELVRPHLAATYRRIREKERASALIQALEEGLQTYDSGVIRLDRRGQIEHATSGARELLDAYFGPMLPARSALPAQLRALAGTHRSQSPRELVIDSPRGRLRVRELQAKGRANHRTLVLTENRARPPAINELRSLGLTQRQAQVLRLLACGKPSQQIAAELAITTATVSKHLEHIYTRLGVSSRAEALARLYTAGI